MKVEVDMQKKPVFLIIGILTIITASFIVYAYQSGGPPELFGHSAEEIQLVFQGENSTLDDVIADIDDRLNFLEDTLFIIEDFMNPAMFTDQTDGIPLTGTGASEPNHPSIARIGANSVVWFGEINPADKFDVTFIMKSSAAGFASYDGMTIGLFDAAATANPTNNIQWADTPKIAFERKEWRNGNQNKWLATTSSTTGNAAKTVVNTTATLSSTAKWTKLQIVRADDQTIEFYVDDVLVATTTTNIPTGSMKIGIINHDDTTNAVLIDFFRLIGSNLNRKDISCSLGAFEFTDVTDNFGYRQIAVPAACKQGTGCIIKRVVFDAQNRIKDTKVVTYKQEANNVWTTSYVKGTFINGDAKSNYLMGSYGSHIRLIDDRKASIPTEVSPSTWSLYDGTAAYGQYLYLCSYA